MGQLSGLLCMYCYRDATHPYSGTKVIEPEPDLASMISFHTSSRNLLSLAKKGFVGSGHCEDSVVPTRQ